MRCDTCDFLLDTDDNYCRKCGTPVQVVKLPAVRQSQPPALFRSTAAPLATGAAAVAATAIARWALRQAVRGILSAGRDAGDRERDQRVARRAADTPPAAPNNEPNQVVEIFWYRRSARG